MSKREQRGYSTTDELHGILRHLSRLDDKPIAEQLELAVQALIAVRVASGKPVSVDMMNYYLRSTTVRVAVQ